MATIRDSEKLELKRRQASGISAIPYRIYIELKTEGFRALCRNAPYYLWKKAPDGFPIPCPRFIITVDGTSNVPWFLESGELGAETIREVLSKNRLNMVCFREVLDFGCGCGRILRHWNTLEGPKVYGTDCASHLAHWCQRNLPFAEVSTNDVLPPLQYVKETFDFIYAFSVFTHLIEPMQKPWIEELSRVLKPRGYLLITTHGQHYLGQLTADERREFEAGRLAVKNGNLSGTGLCGVYHPEVYVREKLAEGFDVVDFIPEGARGSPKQDLYLLRKH